MLKRLLQKIFPRTYERWNLGRLAEKTTFTIIRHLQSPKEEVVGYETLFHIPLPVMLDYLHLKDGVAEYPEKRQSYLTGNLKLLWHQRERGAP